MIDREHQQWTPKEYTRKRHPVPFQQGLRLNAFRAQSGDEDRGDEERFRRCWPDGFVCPHCGHDQSCHRNPRKLRRCDRCHRQILIIPATLFECHQRPLTTGFPVIDQRTRYRKGMSAMQRHRLPGGSDHAAWRIQHQRMPGMGGGADASVCQVEGNGTTPVRVGGEAAATGAAGRRAGRPGRMKTRQDQALIRQRQRENPMPGKARSLPALPNPGPDCSKWKESQRRVRTLTMPAHDGLHIHHTLPDARPAGGRGLLDAAVGLAPLVDPCAALAAGEQEVGRASFRPLIVVLGRAENRDHQLAGALIGIAGVAVGPDMGPSLGAHFDDVLAKHTAGEIYFVCRIRVAPPVAAYCRCPPLPVGESGAEIIF